MHKPRVVNLSRRSFLKTGAALSGGLVLGLYVPPVAEGKARAKAKAADATPPFVPNIWLRVGADDTVTLMMCQIEMGQGAMTSMPMMVAEELDADWKKIKLEWAPTDPAYGSARQNGRIATVGSRSTREYWKAWREAGATARAMLVTAAAQTWSVPEESCSTENGQVIHKSSGRRMSYGALAEKASTLPVPKPVALKNPKDFKLMGQPIARLDVPQKVNGSAVFGMDFKVPNMLVARVARCPVFGGKVASFDATKAKAVAGVHQVVQITSGVAVIADNFWAATQGIKELAVKWDEGPNANLNSEGIRRRFAEAAEKTGAVARNDGDAAGALTRGAKRLEAVYEVPYLAHATMEPQNCTAHVRLDSCDVWGPTQSQTSAQQAAMKATGLPASAIQIHPTFLGGGFGRRGESDYVRDAVEASKATGQPVKVIWTREEDMQHDFYRPVTYIRLWGAIDQSGMPLAYMQRVVQPSLRMRLEPSGTLDAFHGVDDQSLSGATNLPYSIPNLRTEYIWADPGIPIGFWRSVGDSVNGYVTESFLDELAAAGGKDPYELRHRLLDKAPRHKGVLDLAAEKAGWGKPLPAGRHRGISVHEDNGSFVSEVAEVSVAPDGRVRVHRIVAAVDCGWIVNPDTIKAQIMSSIVFGLTAALKGEITITDGRVAQNHFLDYPMVYMNEAPEVEVYIVNSTEVPGGMGEPGVPPVASAVVNAIFAATGKRIRRLPINQQELRTA